MTNNLITLFQAWADQENPPIIELQDINHKPIGALYLDKLSYKKIAIM
jgi:hypothetical protein